MLKPELKNILSIIDDNERLTNDFWIPIEVDIGPLGEASAEIFTFYAVSIERLQKVLNSNNNVLIRRGLIILNTWNEKLLELEIKAVINKCEGNTWDDVVLKLCNYAIWEYEEMNQIVP